MTTRDLAVDVSDTLLRASEAAHILEVPESTFRYWVARRKLVQPIILANGSKRFRPDEIAWLRNQVRLNEEGR
jgi:DNA-binding transcriptional MerR regulator